ncbi:Phospholipid/glycerol acyltransferase [Dillenia turbinata]|uniref:Phospholipid/glycerol acyltransferase n=1 Tax=Dillenia turbinata TaxID=194707 RepID=A0AAN8VG67_9MAGN
MENGGGVSSLRTRRFESFSDGVVSSKTRGKETKDGEREEEIMKKAKSEANSDEEGWFLVAISWVRLVVCFVTMMMTTLIWVMILLLLLPWPYERIKQGNIWGHVTGCLMMKILGNPIKIEGGEFAKTKAIYISNHASLIDIFLVMWMIPTGTVGIAKKEIIFYPLFGQFYVLANHLRIDRSNPTAAIGSLKEAARSVIKSDLSLIIFPEGTRSKTGRLLPFKKASFTLFLGQVLFTWQYKLGFQ